MGDNPAATACPFVDYGCAALYPESPHWSGLSGYIFEEEVSLGKMKREASKVRVFSDATVIVPHGG